MNVRQSDSQGRSEQLLLNGSSMPVLVRPSSGRMYSGISFFHKGQHAQHKPFKCHSSKLHCNDSSYVRVNSADCLRNDIPKDDLILRRHSLEALTNLSYLDYDDDNKPSFEVKKTTYENDERSKEISALFESSTRPSMRQEVEDSSLHQFMKTDNDRHFWKLHNILGLEEQSLPPRKPITRSSLKKRCASSGSNHFQHFNTSHSVERLSTNGKKYPNKDSKDCHFSNNKKMNFLPNIVNSKPNKTTLDEKLENDTFRHSNLSQFQNQHFQTLNSIKVYDALMMVTVSDDKRSKAACKIQRWYKRHNTQENLPLNMTQESACDILKNNFPEDLDENCTSLVKTRIFNGKKYMHSTTPFKPLLPLVERFNEKMPLIYADPTIQNADATFVCDPHYLNEDLSIQLLNAKLLLEKPLLNRKSKLNRRKSDSDMDAIQQNLFLESEIKKSISENVLLSSQQTYLLMHSNLTYNHGTSSNLSECLKQLPGKLDSAVFHHNFSEQVDSLLESTHTNVNEKIDSVDDSKEELKQESAEKPTNNLNSDVVENHSQTLGELKNYNQKEEKKEFEKQELIITKKPPLPNVAAKVSTSETKDFSLVVDSTSHNDTQLSELFNSSSKPNLTSCQSLKEEEKDHSNCVEYSSVITSVTNLHSDEAESLSSRDHSDKSDSSSFPAPETKNESTLTAIKLEELNRNSPQQFSSKYKGLSEDKIQDIMHYLDEVEGSEILQEQEQMAYTQETSDIQDIEDNNLKAHCLEFEKSMIKHLSTLDKLVEDKAFLTENFENMKKQMGLLECEHEREHLRLSDSSSSECSKQDGYNRSKIKMDIHGERSFRKIIRKHKESIRKLKEIHAKKLMELREENTRELAKEMERLKEENHLEIEKIIRRDNEMELMNSSFEAKQIELRSQIEYLEKELTAQKEQYKQETERLKIIFNEMREKEITALQAEYIRRHEDECLKHKKAMVKLEETLTAEGKHEKENLQKIHEAEMLNIEQELREQLKQEHDHQIELALRRVEKDANNSKEEYVKINEYKMKCLREQHEVEIRNIQESQQIIATLNSDLKFQLQKCKEENLLLQASNLQKEKMIDQLNKRNDETISQLKQAFDEFGRINDLKIKDIQSIHASTLLAKEKEMEKLQNSLKQTMKKKDELISQLQEDYKAAARKIHHLEEMQKHLQKQN